MAQGSLSRMLWCLAVAALLALLAAPFVFNALTALGRNVEVLEALRNLEFERVVYRTVLIFAILSLLPVLFIGKLSDLADMGWVRTREWKRLWMMGLCVASLSMLAVYAAGAALGAHVWNPQPVLRIVSKFFSYGVGALLVAVIEETLFRGILFSAFCRSGGWIRAALVSSLLYSLVHFAKPVPPFSTVHGEWDSAFRLVPYMFNIQGHLYHVFPFALTLFLLGMVLAVAYRKTGSLYLSMGLHMGWVWAMRWPDVFLDRYTKVLPDWFSPGTAVSKSYAVLLMTTLFLAGILWVYRKRSPNE